MEEEVKRHNGALIMFYSKLSGFEPATAKECYDYFSFGFFDYGYFVDGPPQAFPVDGGIFQGVINLHTGILLAKSGTDSIDAETILAHVKEADQ